MECSKKQKLYISFRCKLAASNLIDKVLGLIYSRTDQLETWNSRKYSSALCTCKILLHNLSVDSHPGSLDEFTTLMDY